MRTLAIFAVGLVLTNGLGLRSKDDGLDAYDDGDKEVFIYTPSNSNTRPPKSFSDPVTPDTAYHELVPALQVLSDLVTTPKPAAKTIR